MDYYIYPRYVTHRHTRAALKIHNCVSRHSILINQTCRYKGTYILVYVCVQYTHTHGNV